MKTLNLIFLSIIVSIGLQSRAQQTDFTLKEGDLLFQDSDCGPFCDAIEAVTQSINNYNLSHVGLVMQDPNGDLKVMEAISEGVVLTPLDSFLNRSFDNKHQPKVIVGRLKPKYKNLIPGAIAFIHSKMNAEYDDVFNIDNDKYYCSELIHLAFKSANNNTAIFEVQPMTYKEPGTNTTFKIWQKYFDDLKADIPEGKPGLNPGGMSKSSFIAIVHQYGAPSKRLSD
ncbi:YiiX/YebB-like N1pC/P60 family cysteine hydrolase [Formosa sp. S-31]|uniref:YiiX/YebB-like N1pC/P60 family cysteine hydrolase n=1 Tax=Formosa sp. S-31 TaxID=2790949 RepID=UPI003EBF62A1